MREYKYGSHELANSAEEVGKAAVPLPPRKASYRILPSPVPSVPLVKHHG